MHAYETQKIKKKNKDLCCTALAAMTDFLIVHPNF